MTSTEMVQAFISELHEYSDKLIPDTDDIFYYINKAQASFVQERFQKAFERDQSFRDDLQFLIETNKNIEAVFDGNDSEVNDRVADFSFLPDNYLHYIDHILLIDYSRDGINTTTSSVTINSTSYDKRNATNGEKKRVRGELMEANEIIPKLDDPFNTTFYYSPLSFLNNNRITTYTNSKFVVDKTLLTYLREPIDVDFDNDSDIPAAYHEEIIEMAVMNMLQFSGANSSQGKQTNSQE